jgi:hypothetical protein
MIAVYTRPRGPLGGSVATVFFAGAPRVMPYAPGER